ncbi:DNA repair protein RAD50 [Strongyloides ratti]|uniref:DNA repair protein RAD50 n=1 Tax=Strongyloides ratti TaxID=34506 RepID=A0A090LL18_STRRB|nr:DNA repair protein RAD50 [Strongyloides ratti]CEF70410.1 DNA repair protein RAD50 [Strongyloides ratti]
MVNLVGLKIQGIRSLSENYHCIHFNDTITLIQGENGSGKTTIIEALNYATTGSLPSGKVNAFIHNNTLAQKNRVDASVQLQFINVEGLLCTITKRMNSSVKGGRNLTKQDEYTLTVKNLNGSEQSISSKVFDFNKEVVKHFGVSKAVLENVIFCHQENSQWPLSEPKMLKNYFDSIFEVTKYVKAMDHVTKMTKDYESEIKSIDTELPYLESDRNEHLRMIEQHKDLSRKLEYLTSEISSTDCEKGKLNKRLLDTRNHRIQAEEADKKLMLLRNQLSILEKQADEMKDILDYNGSTKELEDEINIISSSCEVISSQLEKKKLEEKIENINKQIKNTEFKLQNFQDELMKYEIGKRQMNELLSEKERIKCQLENDLSIVINEDTDILKKVRDIKNIWECQFDEVMRDIKTRNSDKKRVLNNLKNQLAQYEENISLKREDIKTKKLLISKLNNDIIELKKSQFHRDRYSNKISKLEQEIKNFDESFDDSTSILQQINSTQESIDILKNWHKLLSEREDIKSKIDKKVEENGNMLKKVFTRKLPSGNSAQILERHLGMVEKSLVKSKEKNREKDQIWSETKREIIELTRCINAIEKNSTCLSNDSTKSMDTQNCSKERLEELNDIIEEIGCKKCRENSELTTNYHNLFEARKNFIDYVFSDKFVENQSALKLPRLKEKLTAKKDIFIKYENERKDIQNEVAKIKEKLTNMKCLQRIVIELDCLNTRLQEIEKNIAETKEKFENIGMNDSGFSNDSFVINDIDKLLNNFNDELKQLYSSLKESENVNKLKFEQMKQLGNLKERSVTVNATKAIIGNFKELIKDHEIAIKEYNDHILAVESQKNSIVKEISDLENEIKIIENEFEIKEKQGNKRLKELNNYISLLTNISEKLSKFDNYTSKLVESTATQITDYTETLNGLIKQRNTLELKLSGLFAQQKNFKLLEEQLRKRKITNEIIETENAIEQSELKCSNLKILIKKESTLENQIQKLELENCANHQSHDSILSNIREIQLTINKNKYASASDRYKKKAVRKVVLKKAIRDLEKYKLILDKSIISFHNTKMSEVNLALEELWKRIYKGNDIETIRITSKTKDDSSKRMSYDYMVMMVVDGVEMDMRDRCSSGQKMLACILIRVALSEVFCLNCPILALDEPTTNLDIDKVESIAEMLTELVNYRSKGLPIVPKDDCCVEEVLEYEKALETAEHNTLKKHRNFQLIVITHDEHLVSLLHRNFKPQNVYRLSKDANGVSTIKGHSSIE